MGEKFRRYFLKDKDARLLLEEVSGRFGLGLGEVLGRRVGFERVEAGFVDVFLVGGRPLVFRMGGLVFPTLVFDEFFVRAGKVVVDMGAVPFVCKGADVMRPGVVRFEGEFGKGDVVFVVDVRYGKALAVGEALLDRAGAEGAKKGAVVRNVHFVGDRLWGLIKQL